MTKDEYQKSGATGHYDPVTDSYYTDAQYAELMAGRAASEIAPVVAEKAAKTKPAEPVDGPVSNPTTQD